MKWKVALFAYQREAFGDQVEVEAGPNVRSLLAALQSLGLQVEHSRLAVDKQFASLDDAILPGSVIALIPPVSGG